MNPFILSFADGTTFFVGLALVLMAEALLFRFRNRVSRPIFTVVAIVGIILVIISATPIPIWAYAVWAIPAVAGVALVNRSAPPRRLWLICGAVLVASTLALCLAEMPFRRRPALSVLSQTTVYVLGDSISAGMGTKHRCWPAVLDGMTPLRVVNLAQPGATVESAVVQAKGMSSIILRLSAVIAPPPLIRGRTAPCGTRRQTDADKLDLAPTKEYALI